VRRALAAAVRVPQYPHMSSSTSGPHAAGPTPVPGAPPDQLAELRRALAGRFDVERLLGAGGMGSVYMGRDVTLDRPVAIKVVNPEVALAPTVRARFLAEARTVARLRHPHVVAVHAAGEADELLYFVMEYVPGESLRDRLARDGRFDDRAAVVLLRDLARALGYAHAQGIVHRDVKPENVLLDRDSGRAMLTDFGVAQALAASTSGPTDDDASARLTGMGIVLGSPRYMSPEQAAGERRLDGRSDVYALGLVAYEMFAGEPAVTATSAATILVKHLTEKPTPIATRSARVTPALAATIERALEKDPAARWPTADAMADALDEVLAGWDGATPAPRPLGAPAAGAVPGAAAPAGGRRAWRRGLVAGVALGAAALGALGWWAMGRGGTPRGVDPRKSYLIAPFNVQSPDQQLAWLREGSVSMLALDLAQWRDLQVVDYERALDLLRDLNLDGARQISRDDALRLARKAGVWTAVTGVINSSPDSLFVVANVWDVASGKSLGTQTQAAARTADPRALFDALARELLGVPPEGRVALAQATTSSIEAYRAYLDASRALNAWELARADSLFTVATTIDSTFALAHYRRALTLGWGSTGGDEQGAAVRAALRHSARLPARERALVEAYGDFAAAMRAQLRGDSVEENARFVAAQRRYAAVVARDSGDAEAWYGLGDAFWHHRPHGWGSAEAVVNWSAALRAFNRTLALDSSFHLAYSHKMDMYRAAAEPGSPVVLDGDSLRRLTGDMTRLVADPGVVQAKRRAAELSVQEARHWAGADPVPQAYLALARAYVAAGRGEDGVAALDTALAEHPELRGGMLPFLRAQLVWRARPEDGLAAAREALRGATAAGLARERGSDLIPVVMGVASVAALGGSARDAEATGVLVSDARPTSGGPPDVPARDAMRWWVTVAKLGMGVPPATVRATLDAGIALLERLPAPFGPGMRQQSAAALYVAYLSTRDRAYLERLRRWRAGNPQPWPELDALEALSGGDGARAQAIARGFPSADSARTTTGSMNATRWVARAQVLTELGDPRGALAMYEVLDPRRFTEFGLVDPGPALYARSFLARGRLYEELGDRARAVAAYDRFLALWKDADPELDGQRREAREALARLRDAGGTQPVPVRRG
jgi:tetratricopeptide (TPR) repeat protein